MKTDAPVPRDELDPNRKNKQEETSQPHELGSNLVKNGLLLQAQIQVHPSAQAGEPRILCLGETAETSQKPSNAGTLQTILVRQYFCVEIPLTFSAAASAEASAEIDEPACNEPLPKPIARPHTVRFYRNHPAVARKLIETADGRIVLGWIGKGAEMTVTAENAGMVLSYNTPSPPTPASEQFSRVSQHLYASLLAAKLNQMAGSAGKEVAAAIEQADAFLASVPADAGWEKAEDILQPLVEFNGGRLDSGTA